MVVMIQVFGVGGLLSRCIAALSTNVVPSLIWIEYATATGWGLI
jgi:hypothetical protein